MYSTNLIVLLSSLVLCRATEQNGDKSPGAYTDMYNKYCDLQTRNCNHTLHPLCPKFNPIHYSIAQYNFYPLSQDDINFILTTLNTFRNDLAGGKIADQKSGSNLRVVKWSDEYARLLKAKLLYKNVCTEISFTGHIQLVMEEFSDGDGDVYDSDTDEYFFRSMFFERVMNDSISNSPWIDIFRAEFDLIGCVYYEDDDYDAKTFTCYINRYGTPGTTIQMDALYRYGAPCSNCDRECSNIWTNLCDESAEKPPSEYDYYNIMIYVIVFGCTLLFVVLVIRIIIKHRNQKSMKIEMTQRNVRST